MLSEVKIVILHAIIILWLAREIEMRTRSQEEASNALEPGSEHEIEMR